MKRYPDAIAANLSKAFLEKEGIDAFVADENLANTDPPVIFASGGVRLMVSDEDVERAQALLQQMESMHALPDDPVFVDEVPASDSRSTSADA